MYRFFLPRLAFAAAALAITALVAAAPAKADVLLSYSFTPMLQTGADTAGLATSLLKFDITITQPTYSTQAARFANFQYALASQVSLTVSGSTIATNNGTFALTAIGSPFAAVPRANNPIASPLTAEGNGGLSNLSFNFGPNNVAVSSYAPYSSSPIDNPAGGDPVLAADFNGLVIRTPGTFTADGSTYKVPNTTVTATDVTATAAPEQGTLTLFGTMGVPMGLVAVRKLRRRNRK